MLFKVTPLKTFFKVVSLNVIHISMLFYIVMIRTMVIKTIIILHRLNVLVFFLPCYDRKMLKVSFHFKLLTQLGWGLHLTVGGKGINWF